MSLINDALKRASEAQKKREASAAPEPTPSGPALVPVEARRRAVPAFLVPALLVLALGLGAWFMWGWWRARSVAVAAATPQPAAGAAATMPSGASASGPRVNLRPIERPVPDTRKLPKAVGASPAATAPVAATPPARQEFPVLKLQGIYYRLSNPSALINGKTLYLGDEIDDAKLVKIERFNVTVQFGAETRVLKLQ